MVPVQLQEIALSAVLLLNAVACPADAAALLIRHVEDLQLGRVSQVTQGVLRRALPVNADAQARRRVRHAQQAGKRRWQVEFPVRGNADENIGAVHDSRLSPAA